MQAVNSWLSEMLKCIDRCPMSSTVQMQHQQHHMQQPTSDHHLLAQLNTAAMMKEMRGHADVK